MTDPRERIENGAKALYQRQNPGQEWDDLDATSKRVLRSDVIKVVAAFLEVEHDDEEIGA